jgi:hypothetical protein
MYNPRLVSYCPDTVGESISHAVEQYLCDCANQLNVELVNTLQPATTAQDTMIYELYTSRPLQLWEPLMIWLIFWTSSADCRS